MSVKTLIRSRLPKGIVSALRLFRISINSPKAALDLILNKPHKAQKHFWYDHAHDTQTRLARYYDSALTAPHRNLLADELATVLNPSSGPFQIFDFGAFGGGNLRVIENRFGSRANLFCADPSADAVRFIQARFPTAKAFIADDKTYVKSHTLTAIPMSAAIICFVLAYIPHGRVRALFEAMGKHCAHLLLYDGLFNLAGKRTFSADARGNRPGNVFFYHPYRRLLEQTGWTINKVILDGGNQIRDSGLISASRTVF